MCTGQADVLYDADPTYESPSSTTPTPNTDPHRASVPTIIRGIGVVAFCPKQPEITETER